MYNKSIIINLKYVSIIIEGNTHVFFKCCLYEWRLTHLFNERVNYILL